MHAEERVAERGAGVGSTMPICLRGRGVTLRSVPDPRGRTEAGMCFREQTLPAGVVIEALLLSVAIGIKHHFP